MDVQKTYNGKWELRWTEGSRKRSRTFDRKSDAQNFYAWQRRRRQLGQAAVPDDVKLGEFVEIYWRLHALPNLVLPRATSTDASGRCTSCRASDITACVS